MANRPKVICRKNVEYLVSLTIGKVYDVWEDTDIEKLGLLRIVDDTGTDYLYPANFFEPFEQDKKVSDA